MHFSYIVYCYPTYLITQYSNIQVSDYSNCAATSTCQHQSQIQVQTAAINYKPWGEGIRAGLGLRKVMALSIQQVSSPSAIKRFLWIPKHIIWPLQCLMVTSCRHAQFIKAVQFYSKSSVCHNPQIPSTRQEITESSISLDMYNYVAACSVSFCIPPPKKNHEKQYYR